MITDREANSLRFYAIRRTLLCLSLVCCSSISFAADGQWYLGLGGGVTTLEPETTGSPFRLDQTNATGYKLFAGYDWKQKFSFEGFYAELGEATFTNGSNLNYSVFGLGLNYYVPDNDVGPSLFLKLGMGGFNNSGTVNFTVENSTQVYAGVGVEIKLENGYSIRGEFDYYDRDAQFFGLSISKRFGRSKDYIPDWARDMQVGGPEFDSEESGYTTLKPEDMLPEDSQRSGVVESIPDLDNPSILTSSLGVLEGVSFVPGTTTLQPESLLILDRVIETIQSYGTTNFVLIGHTDDVGDPASNRELSLQQVKEIGAYLRSKGVDDTRLSYIGAGEDEPRTRNDSPEGRAMNRRIELLLN